MARKKTPRKSSRAVAVRSANGGTLQSGNPGNVGGTGRPPSFIREQLRGSFQRRIRIIDEIADGKPVQHAQLPLAALIPHVVCANCGESQIAAKETKDLLLLTFDAQVSASPKDRLAALDLQAKYGLGALKEISIENVRERVIGTLAVIREHVAPEVYQRMLPALRTQWA